MRAWIAVGDRLPEASRKYLVAHDFREIAMFSVAHDKWTTECGEDISHLVTHWTHLLPMPVPEEED